MSFKRRRLSISKKLTLIYSRILFSILIVFTILMFFSIRFFSIESHENELITNADIISGHIGSMLEVNRSSFANLTLGYGIFYSVFDKAESLIYTNNTGLPFMDTLWDDGKNRSESGIFDYDRQIFVIDKEGNIKKLSKAGGLRKDRRVLLMNKAVTVKNTTYHIQVVKDLEEIGEATEVLPKILIITGILGTLLCISTGPYLSRTLLKPIHDISRTAKEITAKNLDKRIPVDGPDDELKDLAQTFNSMIERLEGDFERQKQFASDASHELRTPLSIIHGHVNMLNRWGKNDPQVLDQSLATLKRESENMSRLIENLMYLAKGDTNANVTKKEVFGLKMLFEEVMEETQLTNSGYSISCMCDENLMINADYNALKQVLRILMDNSIKFSTPAGDIWIKAEEEENSVLIAVSDKGVGIPSECLPHIFDRFYRVDESRSKATGGAGLGLAIARQIVQSHDGTITAESELGKGTTIALRLPAV